MWEMIIVAAAIAAAAAYTVYRIFARPSCGCGGACGGHSPVSGGKHTCCGGDSGCGCGK